MEPDSEARPLTYRFGEFALDPETRVLTKAGARVPLTPKAAGVLLELVGRAGQVVTKEDLLARVWEGVNVDERTLTQNIFTARKALESVESIESIAKVGYRFLWEVREDFVEDPPAAPPPLSVTPAPVRSRQWFQYAAIAGVALGVLFAAWFWTDRTNRRKRADALVVRGLQQIRSSNRIKALTGMPMFEQALNLVPGYPLARAALAESAGRMGKSSFQKAIELVRLAVRDDPTW